MESSYLRKNYYPRIQHVLDKYDIAFIDDEVICGFGRTGKPFGAESMDIRPTTMSIAKALSSAYLPISAVLIPENMYEAFAQIVRVSSVTSPMGLPIQVIRFVRP